LHYLPGDPQQFAVLGFLLLLPLLGSHPLAKNFITNLPNACAGLYQTARAGARRACKQIQRMTAQQRQQQQEPKYRELLRITGQ